MENVLFDEQTINANIQYALSVIAENVDKNGNLIVPEPASMDETAKLFAKIVSNPQKSFADIAKSPKAEPEFSTYIVDQSCTNEITMVMHDAIADRRGKDAILVIVCAMELGIITRLPYLAAKKEFPSVGGRSNYNKYLSDGFLDSEKEPIKQLFKKRLPQLFS